MVLFHLHFETLKQWQALRPNIFILERYELNSTIGYRNSFRKQNQCLTPAFMVYKIKNIHQGLKSTRSLNKLS